MILLSSALSSFVQLLGVLIIFVFVLLITYFTTKWIGNAQKTNPGNKNLRIMESIRIGNNKFVTLVKAGKNYLVIAVGKDEVSLLAELTEEQLTQIPDVTSGKAPFTADKKAASENFQDILNKVRERFPKK